MRLRVARGPGEVADGERLEVPGIGQVLRPQQVTRRRKHDFSVSPIAIVDGDQELDGLHRRHPLGTDEPELDRRRAPSRTRSQFTRQAVIKHLTVLEHAALVTRHRAGREVLFRVDADRLDDATRAMAQQASDWDRRLATIKRLAERAQAAGTEPLA